MEFAAGRPLVQGLDVLQNVLKTVAARVDLVLSERIKHEGVIRVW
jgi:hypothetical protein